MMGGIQRLADEFVEKCAAAKGDSVDVYVGDDLLRGVLLTGIGLSALLRFGFRNSFPLPSLRDELDQ